jgi:hypothetical protein
MCSGIVRLGQDVVMGSDGGYCEFGGKFLLTLVAVLGYLLQHLALYHTILS